MRHCKRSLFHSLCTTDQPPRNIATSSMQIFFFFFLLLRARLVFLFFSDGFDPWRKTFLLSSRRANCLANGSLFREKRTLQSRKSHPEPENVSAVFEDSSSFHLSLKWLRNSFVTTASKQRSILSSTPPKSSR